MKNAEGVRVIDAEIAAELHEVAEPGESAGEWTYEGAQLIRRARWQEFYWMILRHDDGSFWGIQYAEPKTEEQEGEYPWKEKDEVLLIQLYPREIVTVKYYAEPEGSR